MDTHYDEIALDGIYTDNYPIYCREDKENVKLYGYKPASVRIARWLDCHSRGFIFVPGTMQPFDDPQRRICRYTHAEALWQGTLWLVLDLDRDDDGFKLHDPTHITDAEPMAETLLYCVIESVSSLVEHRGARFHGFALCEREITRRQEYDALMFGLETKLCMMTGAGRQPAQPVYGNAKPNHYRALFESVLTNKMMDKLIEIGYEIDPRLRETQPQARDFGYNPGTRGTATGHTYATDYEHVRDEKLRQWLSDYSVPLFTGVKYEVGIHTELYYVPCPFRHAHSDNSEGPTDACITVLGEDGSWGFKCFHVHCRDRHWAGFRDAIACPVRHSLCMQDIKPQKVEHTDVARVYRGVPCPICQEAGDAIYNIEQNRGIYACGVCPPIAIQDYQKQQK